MMNFSRIFRENEKITIPAEAFVHLVCEAAMFGILEHVHDVASEEDFIKLTDILVPRQSTVSPDICPKTAEL